MPEHGRERRNMESVRCAPPGAVSQQGEMERRRTKEERGRKQQRAELGGKVRLSEVQQTRGTEGMFSTYQNKAQTNLLQMDFLSFQSEPSLYTKTMLSLCATASFWLSGENSIALTMYVRTACPSRG